MDFAYFADPANFAYMAKPDAECHICKSSGDCLDGGNLSGLKTIAAVCFPCLKAGRLVELDISTNEILQSALDPNLGDPVSISKEIVYCTPSLPTWQDSFWPIKNGRPNRFLKIASKRDYASKEEFLDSLHDCDDDDPDWLWDTLPDHAIRNMKEGQYDMSFYLFEFEGDKLTFWDAN